MTALTFDGPATGSTASQRRVIQGLMLASGAAGLGYQVVWTQQAALWLGHESAAVLAVVAAFFGGLALGALMLGPAIDRSRRPLRWYAACEAMIAVWGLALVAGMPIASQWLLGWTGAQPTPAWQSAVAFGGTFLLLLPATAAMGATLPAVERLLSPLRAEGRSIAALYASNTLGAVIGVLATAFWLVPQWGLGQTAMVCVGINLLCAAAAVLLLRAPLATDPEPPASPGTVPAADAVRRRRALAALAWTGLLGIGYEVLVVRVLSQVTEDTVYTFALLLAVYLIGTAVGAAAYPRLRASSPAGRNAAADRDPGQHQADRRPESDRNSLQDPLRDRLFGALALACLLGTLSLWGAESVRDGWIAAWAPSSAGAMAAALGAEAALALLAFGLPTLVMGALFSHLAADAKACGLSFGQALGANTLGAAAAPALFGVLLAPLLGPKAVLLAVVLGYLALRSRAGLRSWATLLPAGATVAVAALAPPLAFVDVPDGGHIVAYQDGALAAVSVVDDGQGVLRLRINNRQQEGSSATRLVDGRQALLPLLLHPAPQRALFLGLGTGVTASTATLDPALQVDAVELLPEVITASAYFGPAPDAAAAPRLHRMAADARRYVRVSPQAYDLIASDNFHPARSGSGALYTVEHFQAVRQRLAAGGVFCQWLPLHQLDLETLRSIVRSFLAVYPQGSAMLASNSLETPVLGLIGRADDGRFDRAALQARLAAADWAERPADFGIDDEFALFGNFVGGPRALTRWAGSAPANTDDRPIVAYRAPRLTYAPDTLPRDRLITLLHELQVAPEEIVDSRADAGGDNLWPARLAAYFAARTRFIEAGREVRPSADVRSMLAQVERPLLAIVQASPDFRPAYDPLWRMAQALARTDPAAARSLLTALAQAQPARPEAAAALQALPR